MDYNDLDHAVPLRFFTPIRVRYADIDGQRRVYCANYLTYFDIALTDYFAAIGCSYECMLADGIDFYYVEALTQFTDGARFDEELRVHLAIERFGHSSFTARVRIDAADGRPINRGHLVGVTVDRVSGRPVRVPDALRQAVARYEDVRPGSDDRLCADHPDS